MVLSGKGQRWHYLAVKKKYQHYKEQQRLSIVWIVFIILQQKSHKKVCKNKDFCNVIIPSEDTKILEFNQYQKHDKAQSIFYADLEYIV